VKAIDFIFAARPMLLLPVWSIYLICIKLMHPDDLFGKDELISLISLTLVFAGTYYINQLYDYKSDLINKKLGFLQKGIITGREMSYAYIGLSLFGVILANISGRYLGSTISLIFLLGYLYSAPPARLKDRAMGGLLANIIAYGVLIPAAAAVDIEVWGELINSIIIYFALIVGAGYLLTIIPDREGDKRTGKTTIAAYLSDRPIIMIGLLLLLLSICFSYMTGSQSLILISSVSAGLFFIAFITISEKLILFSCKFPILMTSLLAGYFYPIYLIFIVVLIVLTRLYYKKRFGMVYPKVN